ncbi:MAG TPA: phosphoribosylanthranilate isomerase [Bacillales bacterium]|nr:phosphoribosylanthranilate isomerase [Bacillales bacterium]
MKIKYCGNHSLQNLELTTNSLASYIGIVFAKESKRCVDPRQAAEWLEKTPLKPGQKLVGLFVNAAAEKIKSVVETVPLDIIQCHGSESPEQVKEIAAVTGLPVWKAIHHDESALDRMRSYEGIAAGYVVDCKVKGQWGGTGRSFDWTVIPDYTAEAERQEVLCLIAGGVRADNVEKLLRYEPHGIDLSSGIETNGEKDQEEIRRLEERMKRNGIVLSR